MDGMEIVGSAMRLGFDKCGIIPVGMMQGYGKRLEERIRHFPETEEKYGSFRAFARLKESYLWAEAVVVCSYCGLAVGG